MGKFTKKLKLYIATHKIVSGIILIVILLIGYWGYKKFTSTSGDIRYITAKVEKGAIIASISGSGQVSSLNQVDIKAKVSGDIAYLPKQDGDIVSQGALIAQLDTKEAQKSVRDAEVNLESAQIALEKLKIQKSNENMTADLTKAYDDGFTTVLNTFLDLSSTITSLEDILAQENISDNVARSSGKTALNYRNEAEKLYYKTQSAFEEDRKNFRVLDRNSSKIDIENIINKTYETTKLLADAIKSTKNLVDYLSEDLNQTSSFTSLQNTLSQYTNTINEHLSNLLSVKTNIKNYKDSFLSADLDVKSAELSIKQKENTLQDAKDKLADYFIRAPFDGTVAKINIEKSDTISAGTVVATLITKKQLAEISLNEVDVAKIKIGQKTTLTFDAIPNLIISGVVDDIDTIGTVLQGVVTYIVKISFDTQDERVKPGMSVSATIITDVKQNVLMVPNGALKSRGGQSYVEKFNVSLITPTDGSIGAISKITPNKIPVKIGISSDSQSEIISGIKEGDEIITRIILPTTATKTVAPSLFGGTGGNRVRGK